MMKKITIVGGGLAGLGLANGLQLAGVEAEVFEAGRYPRHRVCGEFLAGLEYETLQALGLEECFKDALHHRTTRWFVHGKPAATFNLPQAAPGISRYRLDERMATLARQRGAVIHEGVRGPAEPAPGRILTIGRPAVKNGFSGMKAHWGGLSLEVDLELHLGRHCYTGLSRVEDGYVNVCGLFRKLAAGTFTSPVERFYATLKDRGLGYLVPRLRAARFREGSLCGVSGLKYRFFPYAEPGALGDRRYLIPPFTGNGMTIALQSAETVLPHLEAWARDSVDWDSCQKTCSRDLRRRFRNRLLAAGLMHPLLLQPAGSRILSLLCRTGLLPFSPLYQLSHA